MGDDEESWEEEFYREETLEEEEARSDFFAEMHQKEEARQYAIEHKTLVYDLSYRKRFYGRFIHLDTWLLFNEAVPIYFCYEPQYWISGYCAYIEESIQLLRQIAAGAGYTLNVLNPSAERIEWRVKPKEFIKWVADKDFDTPVELADIFGLDAEGKSQQKIGDYKTHGNTEHHAQRREKILAAALAVLSAVPDKCQNKGKISSSAIADQIELFGDHVYGQYEDPPLSRRTTIDTISKALKLIPEK